MGRNARDFLRFVSTQWKYFAAVLDNQIIYLILFFFSFVKGSLPGYTLGHKFIKASKEQ